MTVNVQARLIILKIVDQVANIRNRGRGACVNVAVPVFLGWIIASICQKRIITCLRRNSVSFPVLKAWEFLNLFVLPKLPNSSTFCSEAVSSEWLLSTETFSMTRSRE